MKNKKLYIIILTFILSLGIVKDVRGFAGGEHLWIGDNGYNSAIFSLLTRLKNEDLVVVEDPGEATDQYFAAVDLAESILALELPPTYIQERLGIVNIDVSWILDHYTYKNIAILNSVLSPIKRLDGTVLSYGTVIALSGDFVEFPSGISRDGLARIADNDFSDLLTIFNTERNAAINGSIGSNYPDEALSLSFNSPDYAFLAIHNTNHFTGHNLTTYVTRHNQALELANTACQTGDMSLWNEALIMNGFADHFLTDMFAAGHMRVPRLEIQELFREILDSGSNLDNLQFVDAPAGLMAMLLHNYDNQFGIRVENNDFQASSWMALGDTNLFAPAHARGRSTVEDAVDSSLSELINEFINCRLEPQSRENNRFQVLSMIPMVRADNQRIEMIFNICTIPPAKRSQMVSNLPTVMATLSDTSTYHVDILIRNLPGLMFQFGQHWQSEFAPGLWNDIPQELKSNIISLGNISSADLINFEIAALEDILVNPYPRSQYEIEAIMKRSPQILGVIPESIRQKLQAIVDLDAIREEINSSNGTNIQFDSSSHSYVHPCDTSNLEIVNPTNILPQALQPTELNEIGELLDMIFVIDTTGSMEDDIDRVKENALDIIDEVASSSDDWQIGIVVYRDYGPPYGLENDEYLARAELPFSSDRNEVSDAIQGITIRVGAGDAPEAVYSGLMTAIQFPWRNGARKVIILMGDAPPHDPEPESGYTSQTILQAAYDVDPASIFPLLIESENAVRFPFQVLADGSSGRLFYAANADEVVPVLLSTINEATGVQLIIGLDVQIASLQPDFPIRTTPSMRAAVVSNIPRSEHATIIAGPEVVFEMSADNVPQNFIWWQVETASGNVGWMQATYYGEPILVPFAEDNPVLAVTCTLSTIDDVNIRSGPGTHYQQIASREGSGQMLAANGQYGNINNPSEHWWQLFEGFWVRNDGVREGGDCANLPVIAAP